MRGKRLLTAALVLALAWPAGASEPGGDGAPAPSTGGPPAAQILELPPLPVPAAPPVDGTKAPAVEKPDETKGEPAKPDYPHVPEMLGDQFPVGSLLTLPLGPFAPPIGPGHPGQVFVPSARYFKIADNDSPRPQTREYFSFNYFYDLFGAANRAAGGGVQHTRIHREIWGWEWAADDGLGSVGLRLPLDTYNASSTVPGLDGTSTDIGDLSVIFKRVLWQDPETGSLFSAGLAVTPPTGPGSFAGSENIKRFHATGLQPFCGWIWSADDFFLQGFTAVDAVADLNDVVLLTNDIGAGYFLYQHRDGDSLTAVVPTVEVHVNTPLSHRGALGLTDGAGTPDAVDLTGGVNLEFCDRTNFAVGFSVPVTVPRPFDFEILTQFCCHY
ncbi:MAG TPA: hypothetical protein VJ739_12085 [Gemmataceae bacterium]|nr:hypothetical protein [Gemmataceae bacterium]